MDRLKINHSKWVKRTDGKVGECEAYCLRCGRDVVYQVIDNRYRFENYCPHCGAKMDLKSEKMTFKRALEIFESEMPFISEINEDALKILDKAVDKAVNKQIPKKIKECTRTSCNRESIREAVEYNRLHSQTPMIPIPKYKEWKWTEYRCPICDSLVKDGKPNYCWNCGQALDWSDEK